MVSVTHSSPIFVCCTRSPNVVWDVSFILPYSRLLFFARSFFWNYRVFCYFSNFLSSMRWVGCTSPAARSRWKGFASEFQGQAPCCRAVGCTIASLLKHAEHKSMLCSSMRVHNTNIAPGHTPVCQIELSHFIFTSGTQDSQTL